MSEKMRNTGRNTRQDILDAARILIKRYGYYGLSVNQVIEKSGTSKGTFYYYFPSKEDLISEIISIGVSKNLDSVRRALDSNSDVSKAFETLFDEVIQEFNSESEDGFLFDDLGLISPTPTIESARIRKTCAEFYTSLREVCVNRLMRSGRYSPETARHLGLAIQSMTGGAITEARVRQSSEPLHMLKETVLFMLVDASHTPSAA